NQHIKVEHAPPILPAIEQYSHFFSKLFGLGEGENLEEFVECAEASRKDHESLGKVGKPEFAHEEVMELEVELRSDVRVGHLLEGQGDVEADGFASRFACATVGGFHNPGTSAGGNHETMALAREGASPTGEDVCEASGILVVVGHVHGTLGAMRLLLVLWSRLCAARTGEKLHGLLGAAKAA